MATDRQEPGRATGEKVIVYGRIYQFDSFTGTDMFMAVAGPTKNEAASDTNTTFVGNAAMLADFVEDDQFRAEAVVVGADNYETTQGGAATAPKLQITSIRKF